MGSRLLNNPKAMRAISFVSGVILVVLAVKLGGDAVGWILPPSKRQLHF